MSPGVGVLLVALGLVGMLYGSQILVRWWTQRRIGQPMPVVDGPDGSSLALPRDGVLWFHTPTCGPCRAMRPGLERWISTGQVRPIDASVHPEIALAFGVLGTPTLIRVRGGHIDGVHTGVLNPGALAEFVGAAQSA